MPKLPVVEPKIPRLAAQGWTESGTPDTGVRPESLVTANTLLAEFGGSNLGVPAEEVRRAGMYRELWQSFAILPGIRSVGVQGDGRTYAYPLIVRAVMSEDAMTADWARLPYEVLERISSRVINEVEGINRVAYDISSKPPSTIEWE